jgi:hypothetical protein
MTRFFAALSRHDGVFARATAVLGLAVGLFAWAAGPVDSRVPSTQLRQDVRTIQGGQVSRSVSREGVIAYKAKDGGIVLTNRPERYSHFNGYHKKVYEYDPITVPNRLRTGTADFGNSRFAETVRRYARQHNLDEALIYAVIRCESNFDAHALSPKGAQGLMQLMPGTASDMGVKNPFNASENVAGGTKYLAMMLREFRGNLAFALAGYNAGPNAVKKHKGIPPYAETRNYVRNVLTYYRYYKRNGFDPEYRVKRNSTPLQAADAGAAQGQRYVIHFESGLKQTADRILDHDPYYYIQFQGQTRRILKDRVKEIVESA